MPTPTPKQIKYHDRLTTQAQAIVDDLVEVESMLNSIHPTNETQTWMLQIAELRDSVI
jgi:hypothetical protein